MRLGGSLIPGGCAIGYAGARRTRVAGDSMKPRMIRGPAALCAKHANYGSQSVLCRPLRGLAPLIARVPRARGLAVGYTLSPTPWAGARSLLRRQTIFCRPLRGLAWPVATLTQGSRTRPGLHAFAHSVGWGALSATSSNHLLSPATRACVAGRYLNPGLADSPWATRFRPLRRLLAPWAARSVGCSLRGLLAPWAARSVGCSLRGLLAPW